MEGVDAEMLELMLDEPVETVDGVWQGKIKDWISEEVARMWVDSSLAELRDGFELEGSKAAGVALMGLGIFTAGYVAGFLRGPGHPGKLVEWQDMLR